MDGYTRRKEQKKEGIRRAALELFQDYGFEKVSLIDVARRAQVSPVTIYNHFGSKEGLVRDVVQTHFVTLLDGFRELIRGDRPFPEKLESILFDKTRLAGQFRGELMRTLVAADPAMQQFIEDVWLHDVHEMMTELYECGKREGYINPELDVESVLAFFDVMRRGITGSPEIIDNTASNMKLVKDLMALYVYGLIGKRA